MGKLVRIGGLVCAVAGLWFGAAAAPATIVNITESLSTAVVTTPDESLNDNNVVTFFSSSGSNVDVFVYSYATGSITNLTTDSSLNSDYPSIGGGDRVAFDRGGDVFRYTPGVGNVNLTATDAVSETFPSMNSSGHVAYNREGNVWLYDGSANTRISTSGGSNPSLNDSDHLAYSANGIIYLWDGSTNREAYRNLPGVYAAFASLNNLDQIAFATFGGSADDIYILSGGSAVNLTATLGNDFQNPSLNNRGQVVFDDGTDVFLYSGTQVVNLTAAFAPAVSRATINNNGVVAFSNGTDVYILVPEPSTLLFFSSLLLIVLLLIFISPSSLRRALSDL